LRLSDFPEPIVAHEQVTVFTEDIPVGDAIAHHLPFIAHAARLLAGDEEDLADDLYQSARECLWKHDPSRYSADDEAYIRSVIYSTMLHARRKELRRRMIPLTGRIRRLTMGDGP
jgi:DNA-directed RNA polymerase specialized sigma24 family protein